MALILENDILHKIKAVISEHKKHSPKKRLSSNSYAYKFDTNKFRIDVLQMLMNEAEERNVKSCPTCLAWGEYVTLLGLGSRSDCGHACTCGTAYPGFELHELYAELVSRQLETLGVTRENCKDYDQLYRFSLYYWPTTSKLEYVDEINNQMRFSVCEWQPRNSKLHRFYSYK